MKQLFKKIINLPALKTDKKLIVLFSDDWGSVRLRSLQDKKQLVAKGLCSNNRFNQYDALETNSDMERLFEVLLQHKDCKGNHPVITAVTNVANPDFNSIQKADFKKYYFENSKETYLRYEDSDNVLDLVKEGINQKIFVPQSHGREHLQVNWWLQELQNENSNARKAFEHQFFFLDPNHLSNAKRGRGIGAAFDVWDKKDIESHKEIVSSALTTFEELYGYKSKVFTPPAMLYNPNIEKTLVHQGIEWLDVGRFFKIPLVGGGERYQYNYLGRKKKSGLKVLVRNCMFESNIATTDNGVMRCLQDIEAAFKAKQPALISNHRACFVGRIDKKNSDIGLKALDMLMKAIILKWPDAEFITGDDLTKKI